MNWRHFTHIQRDGYSAYMVLFCNYHLKTLALYRKKSSPCFRIRDSSARRTSLVPREKDGKRGGITKPSTPTRYLAGRPYEGVHDQVVAADRPIAIGTVRHGGHAVRPGRIAHHAPVHGTPSSMVGRGGGPALDRDFQSPNSPEVDPNPRIIRDDLRERVVAVRAAEHDAGALVDVNGTERPGCTAAVAGPDH